MQATWAQFPRNLVQEFEKTASKRFREDALVDATERTGVGEMVTP
jgi:hypothetical protein